MRSWREQKALTTQPSKCRSHTIMARILSKLVNVLTANSLILWVCDVLTTHRWNRASDSTPRM